MRISVAMATWNGAAHVRQQLESIARQSRPPDEIVVSDDSSDDATLQIVEDVARRRALPVLVLRNDRRVGIGANFGRAIAATTGDIVFLSDQDDVWAPNKVAVVAAEFARSAELGGVFSDGRVMDQEGRRTGANLWGAFGFSPSPPGVEAAMARRLLRSNVVTGATLAFAGRLREVLLPVGAFGLHDSWIALLVAMLSELRPIPLPLIDYRVHPGNAEGLGVRRARPAVRQRLSGTWSDEARQLDALRARLAGVGGGADLLHLLDRKIEHVRFRAQLPGRIVARGAAIATALPEYRRFSSSWRSPLLDLAAPRSSAASTDGAPYRATEDP